jgi:hypothetical protein
MGEEADRARDHAESMDWAEKQAALEEADAYERDRWQEKEFLNGPPSVGKLPGYFDDVKPGDMSGASYESDKADEDVDPLSEWARPFESVAGQDTDGSYLPKPDWPAWPADIVERFQRIYGSMKGMTPEDKFLDAVSQSDKKYPPAFNKWYFLNHEQFDKGEAAHDRDYLKREAYTRWKAKKFQTFYNSQMVEGMPDEVSAVCQDLDRAYDDGNGIFIDPGAVNVGFLRFLDTHGQPRSEVRPSYKVQGTVTGRFVSDDVPPVQSVVRKKGKPKVSKREELEKSIAALRQRLDELHAAHERYANRPPEPTLYIQAEDGLSVPPIIFFQKRFSDNDWPNARVYDYAFIAANGKWYGTGPKAPKAYTWDELMDWLQDTGPMPIIYAVSNRGLNIYFDPTKNKEDKDE